MFDDEQELVSGYADFQRASMAIGVGSMVGGKYSKIEQILRAQSLTPQQKFLDSVQLVCYQESIPFSEVYDKIAFKHPHPQYLNPSVCVYVVSEILDAAGKIRANIEKDKYKKDSPLLLETSPLDVYRYAVSLSSLLTHR